MIHQGDSLTVLKTLPAESVNCVVTSPPYWALRSYLPDKVKIKECLSEEKKKEVIAELDKLGVKHADQ